MANYLLLYHGGEAPEGAEAQAQVMEDWTKWFGSLGAAVVDGGNPTGVAKTVSSDGTVSDGGGANPVTGYSVITADNLDAAVAMAKGCPHIASGGSIEIADDLRGDVVRSFCGLFWLPSNQNNPGSRFLRSTLAFGPGCDSFQGGFPPGIER